MKKSRFSNEQTAFALKQSGTGTRLQEVYLWMGISETIFKVWKNKYWWSVCIQKRPT